MTTATDIRLHVAFLDGTGRAIAGQESEREQDAMKAVRNALEDCANGHVDAAETADDIRGAALSLMTDSPESLVSRRLAASFLSVATAIHKPE